MSIVFAVVLGMYAMLRALLWVCAQFQLCLDAAKIPQVLALRPSPDELPPELRPFFEQSAQTLRELSVERNRIGRARRSDPDVYFGYLRSVHYRRAIIDSHRCLSKWLESAQDPRQGFHSGTNATPGAWMNWPADANCARKTLRLMQEHLKQARYGRALEPFALDEVMAIERSLDSFSDKLRATMDLMVQSRGIGYRNAAYTPPPQTQPQRGRSSQNRPSPTRLPKIAATGAA